MEVDYKAERTTKKQTFEPVSYTHLKEVAYQKIDEQTEALVSMIGDNQVDYRFFLGFKLMVTEEQLNLKNIKKSAWLTFKEFLHEVNHTLMNDFVSMPVSYTHLVLD